MTAESVCSGSYSQVGLETLPSIVSIHPDDFSKLMWNQASLHGFPEQQKPERFGKFGPPFGTQQWNSTIQFASWEVKVAQSGEYSVGLLYLSVAACSQFEVSAGRSKVTDVTRETGNAWRKPGWEVQQFPAC
jgi:hypothetical protein